MQTFTLNVYKIFLFKKKTMKCLIRDFYNARFLLIIILRIFKCIASTDNAFKILVTLNLAHTVS